MKRTWSFAFGLGLLLILVAHAAGRASLASEPPAIRHLQSEGEVYVPTGQFLMGCSGDLSPLTCDSDAAPIHAVYLDAFYIDKTEVTNEQYAACVAAGGCPRPSATDSETRSEYYGKPEYSNYPVINVDWDRANAYCRWAGKRLPTEAEWEKAARGSDLRWFAWGNDTPTCDRLNFRSCVGDTVAVGSYPAGASPYGALDMIGNVREWVSDLYDKKAYAGSRYYNPTGPASTPSGQHLVRGGSWKDDENHGANTWVRLDESDIYKMHQIGFRCARSAPDLPTPSPTPSLTPSLTPSPTLSPTPSPTPSPTSSPTPTALPLDTRAITTSGGLLWLAYPGHVTMLYVPPNALAEPASVTLRYEPRPASQGELEGLDHFFAIEAVDAANRTSLSAFDTPVDVTLTYLDHGSALEGSIDFYRLEAARWVTAGITSTIGTGKLPGAFLAQVRQTGSYGLLGRSYRCYLPILLRTG